MLTQENKELRALVKIMSEKEKVLTARIEECDRKLERL